MRLATLDGREIVGRVLPMAGDGIRLRVDRTRDTVTFPAGAIRSYAVSRGVDRGHAARTGALVGGGIGVALLDYAAYEDKHSKNDLMFPGTLFAAPVAVALTLVGAGVGALLAPERFSAPLGLRAGYGKACRRGPCAVLTLRF